MWKNINAGLESPWKSVEVLEALHRILFTASITLERLLNL